jgi:hypothetical protein
MSFALPSSAVLADGKNYITQSDGVYLVSALNRIDQVMIWDATSKWVCLTHKGPNASLQA